MSPGSRESSDGTPQNSIETFPQGPGDLHAENYPASETSAIHAQHMQSTPLADTAALYRPLQRNNRQIRVAIILPDTWRGLGDERDTTTIVIDGRQVPVTVNLHDALKRLRKRDEERIVWADAICINQGDLEERQHQVQMMGDIYSRAAMVQVIMDESSASKSALQLFNTEERDDELPVCRWYNDHRDLPHLQSPRGEGPRTLEHLGAAETYAFVVLSMLGKTGCFKHLFVSLKTTPSTATWASILSVLDEFLERPWWYRIWVVQEVVLAKEAIIHFGQTVFPWAMLDAVYEKLLAHYGQGCCDYVFASESIPAPTWDVVAKLFDRLAYLAELRKLAAEFDLADLRSRRGRRDSQLLRLLVMSKNREAKDQRDKVYGVLGLLPLGWWKSRGVDPIIPDYTRDVAWVFTEACLKVIQMSGSLQILYRNVAGKVTQNLPSWVPDWCHDGVNGGSHCATSQFSSNGDSLGNSRAMVSFKRRDGGKTLLRIRGVLIGEIHQTVELPAIAVSNGVAGREVSSDNASQIARAVGDCRTISRLSSSKSDLLENDHGLSPDEVEFWTTLLGDQCAKKEGLERHVAYQSWIRGSGSSLAGSTGITHPQSGSGGERSRTEPRERTDNRFDGAFMSWRYMEARTFIRMDNGSLGITTVDCRPGDMVYWFLGGWYPFILRERAGVDEGPQAEEGDASEMQEFELVGPCEIPDIMKRRLWGEENHDVVLV
ncbi:Heterokaryon incompatibility protein (HET) domain containing protein [Rhypophila decipiens]